MASTNGEDRQLFTVNSTGRDETMTKTKTMSATANRTGRGETKWGKKEHFLKYMHGNLKFLS